ncbi:hypothetical protein NDU88_002820 [Pleurodeles waltl]|uniref:Uncharacterized protein n=1 Tax=Pleurodeles waltl TaxID=8319 RepID=A0AAV7UAU6_PLEWA|nr:hypothetical protein NDU88_002820 [Pleurodeles waltl]
MEVHRPIGALHSGTRKCSRIRLAFCKGVQSSLYRHPDAKDVGRRRSPKRKETELICDPNANKGLHPDSPAAAGGEDASWPLYGDVLRLVGAPETRSSGQLDGELGVHTGEQMSREHDES